MVQLWKEMPNSKNGLKFFLKTLPPPYPLGRNITLIEVQVYHWYVFHGTTH